MTIIRRTLLGYVGLALLVLIVAALGISAIFWLDSRFADYEETTRAQTSGAAAIREASLPMSHIARAALLADSAGLRTQYSMELEAAFAATSDAIDQMIAIELTTGDANDSELLESMKASLETYYEELTGLIDSASVDQEKALNDLTMTVAPLGRAFDDSVHSYELLQRTQERESADSLSRASTGMAIGMGVLAVLAVAAGILLPLSTSRTVGRQLRGAVASLGSSSAELMAVASQVSASAAETAASTNETSVTVEEVKQTTVVSHEKASSAAKGAEGAVEVIGSAKDLVEGTVQGIERMQGEMDVVFEAINRLSDRALAAGEVIAVVNDLAEQSNLLSVNASIEAAKAGEYGKGFTVVAQEVKSLAEQSKQAVAQVRTMLGEIKKASEMAVQAAANSREAVEEGRQRSVDAGEVMQRVAEGAGDDAEASRQVVASSQQQMAGIEQIAQAITSINDATAQAVSGTRQVEQEIKQLQDLAARLKGLVETEGKTAAEESSGTEGET